MKSAIVLISTSIYAAGSVSAPMDGKPTKSLNVTPSESTAIMPPTPNENAPESGLYECRLMVVTSESLVSFCYKVSYSERDLHAHRWFCWRLRLLWDQRRCRNPWGWFCLERQWL
ncbi:hypothetical protein PG993_013808 [Apiospora rasikravindrae]|uniref:Uncharacterized protein n=1 Tax=Apiospora rasikravindrae TaxID=990691 RepID=A0ABR1RRM5_9PEZI